MIRVDNFNKLVAHVMQGSKRAQMRPVVEKELLYYDILFGLDKMGLMEKLTLQGGTALRLCHGAPRYSEDLNFAGGENFKTADLLAIKAGGIFRIFIKRVKAIVIKN